MRGLALAWIGLFLMGVASCIVSATGPTENELTQQRLANEVRARELYVTGEKAYKAGDVYLAVKSWTEVLSLKPDSDYTRKCLEKARTKLYKQYSEKAKSAAESGDTLTALVLLDSVVSLLPDNKDLAIQAEALRTQLTEHQRTALDHYNRAMKYVAAKDYDNAEKSIANAQTYARESACVKEAVNAIYALNHQLPKMLVITREGCGWCDKIRPIAAVLRQRYAGVVDIQTIRREDQPSVPTTYHLTGYPTEIMLDKNGREIDRITGYVPQEDLVKWLSTVLGK